LFDPCCDILQFLLSVGERFEISCRHLYQIDLPRVFRGFSLTLILLDD
jgi:hypothetical protein